MLVGVFSPVGIFTPVQILVWGLLIDFIAVLSISFQPPSSYVLSLRREEMGLYRNARGAAEPILCGAVWAAVSSLTVALTMVMTGVSASDASVFSGVYISALLCVPAAEHYFMTGHSLFRRHSGAKLRFLMTLAATAVAAVVCTVITGADMINGTPWEIALRALSALLPSMVMFAAGETAKIIKKKKRMSRQSFR
jgi:magnesium-transporting ATPase (P-type)